MSIFRKIASVPPLQQIIDVVTYVYKLVEFIVKLFKKKTPEDE